MKLKSILLIVFILLQYTFIPLIGVSLREIPEKPTVIFSPEYDIIDSIRNLLLDNLSPQDELFIFSPHFTDTDLARYLAGASYRGTKIQVVIDNSSTKQNNTKAFEVTSILESIVCNFNPKGIKKYENTIQMHIKALIWAHVENDTTLYRVFTGSANLSEAAKTNQEHIVLYPNNDKLYNRYKALAEQIVRGDIKAEDLLDANRPKIDLLEHPFVFSNNCNLMKSISNIIMQAGREDEIYISSLSYDDKYDTTKALIKAKEQGANIELIIDRNSFSSLNKKIVAQLNEMDQNKINILLFRRINNDNGYNNETKNHSKYILIKKAGEFIVIEGSANLTYNSNFDINQFTVHRNDQEFYNAFEQYHKELASSGHCTKYIQTTPQKNRSILDYNILVPYSSNTNLSSANQNPLKRKLECNLSSNKKSKLG